MRLAIRLSEEKFCYRIVGRITSVQLHGCYKRRMSAVLHN